MFCRWVLSALTVYLVVLGAALAPIAFVTPGSAPAGSSGIRSSLSSSNRSISNDLIQSNFTQDNRPSNHKLKTYPGVRAMRIVFDVLHNYHDRTLSNGWTYALKYLLQNDLDEPAVSRAALVWNGNELPPGNPCGGPLRYCAPTSVEPLPIPDTPPTVSTRDPFTGKGTMFITPWSNSIAMRLTDGTTMAKKMSFGLFFAGESDPAVRSPMLGARASQNCNNGSPTCYYMRVIGSGATPKIIWIDGGKYPTQGQWQMGELCADNPHYKTTNGYTLGAAYNYGAATGGSWHSPKFLQKPGSEGILLEVELRTAAGARNKGLTGDDAWLIARDLTTCSSSVDVPETPVVDFSALYPAFDPTHSKETIGYGPAFTESTASAVTDRGVVSLQSGIYCVTLSTYAGDDSHGTAVVCYDASLGKGHWFDAISGTVGPDTNGWGQTGPVTNTCATPKCNPSRIYITAVHMNFGLTPYLKLDMAITPSGT